jgi:PAS domain S-box-containing protein
VASGGTDLFEQLPDGAALVEGDGLFLRVNRAGRAILGIKPGEPAGRLPELADGPDRAALAETIAAAAGGRSAIVDAWIRSPDGPSRYLAISAAPADPGTAILGFRDGTFTRSIFEQLFRAKTFLEELIDASPDAVVAGDATGQILVYNKAAERLCGYAMMEALTTLRAPELFPPALVERFTALLGAGGANAVEAERTEVVAQGGERIPVSLNATAVRWGQGEAWAALFSDQRERVSIERKLTTAEQKLRSQEKQAMVAELAGAAAHELNQPLTSVIGYADMLRRKLQEDDPVRRPVDIICREADRMADILRKIAKITRYETTTYLGRLRILDLEKAAEEQDR